MNAQPRSALVTGSTTGIGKRIAFKLAQHGTHVFITGRDHVRAERVVAEITANGGQATAHPSDLTDLSSIRELADAADPVDVLVNNAGIFTFAPTSDQDLAGIDDLFAVNVKAPFALVAAIAPGMVQRGSGAIVNLSTAGASVGIPGTAAYAATKAAVDSLTRTWAAEFGPTVRANAVAPGPTLSEGVLATVGEEGASAMTVSAPLARAATPEEIADAVVFLASPAASYITGTTLNVDGGLLAT